MPGAAALARAIIASGSAWPSRECVSITTSASRPRMRSFISVVKPAITEFTTTIVATPSVTETMLASAMYRVRR